GQVAQRRETECRDMLRQVIEVEGLQARRPNETDRDRPRHLIMEALPDHAEGQRMQLPVVRFGAESPKDARQPLETRPDRLPDQDVRSRRGMQHLPDHQAMPPVVGGVQRQDVAEEMADEPAELLRRLAPRVFAFLTGLDAAAMGLQDGLDVELLLVAEMI